MQRGESELLLLKEGDEKKDAMGPFHRYGGVVGPAVYVGSVSFLLLRFFFPGNEQRTGERARPPPLTISSLASGCLLRLR
jgi:hypothetical protein